MAKERLKSPRARLFVALDLPDALTAGIVAWGREALADPALRPLPVASLHVTLAFLGYRPEKEIGRIGEIVEALAGPAPGIALGDPSRLNLPMRGPSCIPTASAVKPPTECTTPEPAKSQ